MHFPHSSKRSFWLFVCLPQECGECCFFPCFCRMWRNEGVVPFHLCKLPSASRKEEQRKSVFYAIRKSIFHRLSLTLSLLADLFFWLSLVTLQGNFFASIFLLRGVKNIKEGWIYFSGKCCFLLLLLYYYCLLKVGREEMERKLCTKNHKSL